VSTEGAATLLAEIVRLWLRDAATDHQERQDLARFLEMPEQTIAQLARPGKRNLPAGVNRLRRSGRDWQHSTKHTALRGTLRMPNFR